MRIANNYNEFVEKVVGTLTEKLNTEQGQDVVKGLLSMKLKQNPNLTPEEWQTTKQEFLTFLFALFIKNVPETAGEMSEHVWNELQAQN